MKVMHCMSSGQDSTLTLYNLLKDTDHEVYARYFRYTKFFSKNHLDFCEKYVINIANWLKENVRDFNFDIEIAEPPNWSFYLKPKDRVYDTASKEILEKYWDDKKQPMWEKTGVTQQGIAWVLERFYNYVPYVKKLKVDYAQTGNDRLQWLATLPSGANFYKDICDIPIRFPLIEKNMGRIAIYSMLPDELKKVFNQCDNERKEGENWCGECLRCLTRIVYEQKRYTIEETEKIFNDNLNKIDWNDWKKSYNSRYFYNNVLTQMADPNRDKISLNFTKFRDEINFNLLSYEDAK